MQTFELFLTALNIWAENFETVCPCSYEGDDECETDREDRVDSTDDGRGVSHTAEDEVSVY